MAVLAVAQPKKVDWDQLQREYVTEEKTARELARKYGLSNSTVSAKQRSEDWNGARVAYKNAIARRSYEGIADSVAYEQTEIKKESILAARLYVRQFVKDLTDGKVHANAKDAALMIQLLINELGSAHGSEIQALHGELLRGDASPH